MRFGMGIAMSLVVCIGAASQGAPAWGVFVAGILTFLIVYEGRDIR